MEGNTVVGKGASEATPSIQGQVTYPFLENTPLIQMQVKLTNTGSEDYTGYFEYLIDPDESGEDDTYVPGVGWTTSTIKTVLTNHEWKENYIFEGITGKYTGNTAHAILWTRSWKPPAGWSTTAIFSAFGTIASPESRRKQDADLLPSAASAGRRQRTVRGGRLLGESRARRGGYRKITASSTARLRIWTAIPLKMWISPASTRRASTPEKARNRRYGCERKLFLRVEKGCLYP